MYDSNQMTGHILELHYILRPDFTYLLHVQPRLAQLSRSKGVIIVEI